MKNYFFYFFSNKKFHFFLMLIFGFILLMLTRIHFEDINREVKDNYCRIMLSKRWWEDGVLKFPKTSWLPLHFIMVIIAKMASGWDFLRSGEMLSICCGALTIPTLYLFSSFTLKRSMSLLVATTALLTWPFLEFSSMSMAEPIFLLFIFGSLVFLQKRCFLWAGMGLGLATLLRVEAWALLLVGLTIAIIQSLRKKQNAKEVLFVFVPSMCLWCFNIIFFKGNILRPFSSHLQGHASDLTVFNIENGIENFSWAASEFGWPIILFVTIGYLVFFLKEREWGFEASLILAAFIIGILKFVGVYYAAILSDPRYFLLYIFIGLPVATFQFRRMVPASLMALVLVAISFLPTTYTLKQWQRQDRHRLSPSMTEMRNHLHQQVERSQTLALAVTNFDDCWFVIQSPLLARNVRSWPNERQRIRNNVDLKSTDDLLKLYWHQEVDYLLLEKGTIYEKLVREYLELQGQKSMEIEFHFLKENDIFLLYSIINQGFK